jgi:hypothetical protein
VRKEGGARVDWARMPPQPLLLLCLRKTALLLEKLYFAATILRKAGVAEGETGVAESAEEVELAVVGEEAVAGALGGDRAGGVCGSVFPGESRDVEHEQVVEEFAWAPAEV